METKKRFHYEVLAPFVRLRARASRNVCIEPGFNDVISLAKQAAVAAHHFQEVSRLQLTGLDKESAARIHELKLILGDIADSSKHGILRDQNRTVSFAACLSYEFDIFCRYRFIRTEVLAHNGRFGNFEVSDAIGEYLKCLAHSLSIEIQAQQIQHTSAFGDWAETYLTSQSGFDINSTRIKFYRRAEDGTLVAADPPQVRFRVLQATNESDPQP